MNLSINFCWFISSFCSNIFETLIENLKIDADAAVSEAKKIEKYVFQNDFIVEIDSEEQKQALENLIKSLDRD